MFSNSKYEVFLLLFLRIFRGIASTIAAILIYLKFNLDTS